MVHKKTSSLEGRKLKNDLKAIGEALSHEVHEFFNRHDDNIDFYPKSEAMERLRLGTLTLEEAREIQEDLNDMQQRPLVGAAEMGKRTAALLMAVFPQKPSPDPQVVDLGLQRKSKASGISRDEMHEAEQTDSKKITEFFSEERNIPIVGKVVQEVFDISEMADRLLLKALDEAIPKLERLQEMEARER